MSWEAFVARVSGLQSRRVSRATLLRLAAARDVAELGRSMQHEGLAPDASTDAGTLERHAQARATRDLAVAARWSSTLDAVHRRLVAPIYEYEDRRSIQLLLRSVAAGEPTAQRMADLVPTAALPRRALEELAAQPGVREVVALLVAWQHPLGVALREEARRPHPDLLRLDVALARAWAAHATTALRGGLRARSLRREVRAWFAGAVDEENVLTACVLARAHADERVPGEYFVRGGERVTRDAFLSAARSGDATAALLLLSRGGLAGTPLGRVAQRLATHPDQLERALLRQRLQSGTRHFRMAPGGMAALTRVLAAVRAELHDVRRLAWGAALGAPLTPEHDLAGA